MALIDSLPIIELQLDCELKLTSELAKKLVEEAEYYRKEPVDLLADIIEKVVSDPPLLESIIGNPSKRTLIKLDASTPSLYELKKP